MHKGFMRPDIFRRLLADRLPFRQKHARLEEVEALERLGLDAMDSSSLPSGTGSCTSFNVAKARLAFVAGLCLGQRIPRRQVSNYYCRVHDRR